MLAGVDGILKIQFNDPSLAQFIGIISLNFILFSGGLETRWKSVKPIMYQGITLSTLGVLLTAVTMGVFVYYVTDYFTFFESLLLGSKQAAVAFDVQPVLEVEVDLAGVGQAYARAGLRGVDHPDVGAVAPGVVLVLELAVGAIGEA